MTYIIACLIIVIAATVSADTNQSKDFEEYADENERMYFPGCNIFSLKSGNVENDIGELKDKIPPEEVEKAMKTCEGILREREKLEYLLADKGRVIKPTQKISDISINHYKDPSVQTREKLQLPFEETTNLLAEKYDLSSSEIDSGLPQYPLNGELSAANRNACVTENPVANCNANSKYRRIDGQCNNLNNPSWGMATVCQRRLLPASYVGNSGFRTSVDGSPLPEPRTLSLNLHYNLNRPTNYVTHMYMFFGQLLDHDIALTPISTTVDNEAIECCPPESETHPQCRPINIRPDDPFYSQFNITCMNFVRSAICPTCTMGSRQQMDQVTSYIDASFVYGNSENETNGLRMNDGTGRMRTQGGDLLPRSENPQEDQCSFPETNDICFSAGDPRVNQHTVLASLQTIFMREHNRIATGLQAINPQWNEETIFQEARRILGAEMEVITYKEYLPITLGRDRMSYFRLWMSDRGYTAYDRREDATMYLEFTTAGFRFGHSLINSVVAQQPLNATNGRRLLRDEFFQPFDLYNGIIGPLVSGASNSPAQWFDQHLVPDATNFLYRIRGNQTGLDLASININRGRDHGIPPYVEMVRWCSEGRIVVTSFNDLVSNRLMESAQASALRQNYMYVEDVDLWTGILMEIPNDGAVVGPTAACIIGLQFYKLKFGDRFYFEHGNQAGSFTSQQLNQLRQTTLSKIICLNSNANQLPLNAMLFRSRNNPIINCRYVKGIDLSYWGE